MTVHPKKAAADKESIHARDSQFVEYQEK